MKALIEEMLRRNHDTKYPRTHADVKLALDVLQLMLPEGKINIVSDRSRFAQDFATVMRRPYQHIRDAECVKGQSDAHYIVLHTGARNDRQRDNYMQIIKTLHIDGRKNTIWHVGEWRA